MIIKVTDEMVERGAEAIYLQRYPDGKWHEIIGLVRDAYCDEARACLAKAIECLPLDEQGAPE